MRTIVPSLLLGSLVFVMILYLNASHSDLLDQVKYAVLGNKAMASMSTNDISDADRKRITRINSLLISEKNKRDLRDGRPFWGAAQHMLELAFNVPADHTVVRVKDSVVYEFHTFDVAPEPIVFEFQNNKLTCAHYAANHRTICDSGRDSFYANNTKALFSATEAPVKVSQR